LVLFTLASSTHLDRLQNFWGTFVYLVFVYGPGLEPALAKVRAIISLEAEVVDARVLIDIRITLMLATATANALLGACIIVGIAAISLTQ